MLRFTLWLLALSASSSVVNGAIPIFKPRPVEPDPIPPTRPEDPEGPSGPGGVPGPGRMPDVNPNPLGQPAPDPLPAPAEVQTNIGRLEERLENIGEVVDIAKEIAEAILSTASTSDDDSEPTGLGQDATATSTATNIAQDVTITPTASLPIKSFQACQSYARILTSCASATTSYYSLDPTQQASCACYKTASSQTIPCSTASSEYQYAAVPTLAKYNLDNPAILCWSFFQNSGDTNAANALLDSEKVYGYSFCDNIDQKIGKIGSGNSSRPAGLEGSLAPRVYGSCRKQMTQQVVNEGSRAGTLTLFDRGNLFICSIIILVFSWALFD